MKKDIQFSGKFADAVDAMRDCLKVRFSWLFFYWHQWLPVKSEDCKIEIKADD